MVDSGSIYVANKAVQVIVDYPTIRLCTSWTLPMHEILRSDWISILAAELILDAVP